MPTMTDTHLDSGHLIKDEQFEASDIHNVQIYVQSKMVGRALLIAPTDMAGYILLDIVVYNEADRRKGLGDEMMAYLTERFTPIFTSYLSAAGRNLCLKHGFRMKKAFFKRDIDLLTYVKTKEPENAEIQNG